ncbi:hypothetical protein DFJ74DRAFT_138451 [Hyaloraphidium curvatum]|nr:hypothetical protein DFJ74DRAFT_138451 [Hyaloraphidium curvatum]
MLRGGAMERKQSDVNAERAEKDADASSVTGSAHGSTTSTSVLRGIISQWGATAGVGVGVAGSSNAQLMARQVQLLSKENTRLLQEANAAKEEAVAQERRAQTLEVDYDTMRETLEAVEAERNALQAERDALRMEMDAAARRLARLLSSHSDPHRAYRGHEWEPDFARSSCNLCDEDWTLSRRRHHCRSCSKLVCASCSSARIAVGLLDGKIGAPDGVVARVCDSCAGASP